MKGINMNRETAKQVVNVIEQGICEKKYEIAEHWEMIKAFADGARIQAQTFGGWVDEEEPTWEKGVVYRLNPKQPNYWRAREGEIYCYVSMLRGKAIVCQLKEAFDDFDDEYFKNGDYFKTVEEAQLIADKINQIFKLICEGVHLCEINISCFGKVVDNG